MPCGPGRMGWRASGRLTYAQRSPGSRPWPTGSVAGCGRSRSKSACRQTSSGSSGSARRSRPPAEQPWSPPHSGLLERSQRLVVARTAEFDKAAARLPGQLRGLTQEQAQAAESDVRRQLAEVESLLPLVAEAQRAALESRAAAKAAEANSRRAGRCDRGCRSREATPREMEQIADFGESRCGWRNGSPRPRRGGAAQARRCHRSAGSTVARGGGARARGGARDAWLTARERAVECAPVGWPAWRPSWRRICRTAWPAGCAVRRITRRPPAATSGWTTRRSVGLPRPWTSPLSGLRPLSSPSPKPGQTCCG